MRRKLKICALRPAAIACLGLALLGLNGAVLMTPVAGANCSAECSGGVVCACSGKKCSAVDGVGCVGETGEDQSVCECETF